MILKQQWLTWWLPVLNCYFLQRTRTFLKLCLSILQSETIFYTLKTVETKARSLAKELRYWLFEIDCGALLFLAKMAFQNFIKLPLGMAETKRFLHQGLFLSDFSSSLSLRSSVCRKSLMLYLELRSKINYMKRISLSLWNTNTSPICLQATALMTMQATSRTEYTFQASDTQKYSCRDGDVIHC